MSRSAKQDRKRDSLGTGRLDCSGLRVLSSGCGQSRFPNGLTAMVDQAAARYDRPACKVRSHRPELWIIPGVPDAHRLKPLLVDHQPDRLTRHAGKSARPQAPDYKTEIFRCFLGGG